MKNRVLFAGLVALVMVFITSCQPKEELPKAQFTFSVDEMTVSFTNLSVDAQEYVWEFGDGETSTETNPVHTYGETGRFTVLLTAKNAIGENTAEQTIEIKHSDGMRHKLLAVLDTIIPNPERGLHKAIERHSANPTPLAASSVNGYYNAGYTLIHFDFYMEDYRDKLIDESYLEVVRQSLQAVREGGCKAVVRFAYTNSEKQTPHEAPKDLMLQHIAQIKPILQEYVDVIYTMEAGLIGVWGEWYYTSYFKSNDYESRREILDALLDALPQERMLCVRTPLFKQKCYGWNIEDTLTRAEAYTGTVKARLAAHDDAIMADASDLGTFTVTTRPYWEAETKYLIYGGESCPGNGNTTIASCEKTLDQFYKMHISYLNKDYYRPTHNRWKNEGCQPLIYRSLGYCFEGREVVTTMNPKAGEELYTKLSLVNVGWASPKNPRDIEMLLINTADSTDRYSVVPNTDPRFWFTDEMQYIEATFRPTQAGTYKLYLNMPDPKQNLHNDPRYSIRLANVDCWDEKTGYNYLTTITVE